MTPKLTTERLVLRQIKVNDIFGYCEYRSDSETMKLVGASISWYDRENKDIVQIMKKESEDGICYFWTITLKEEKEFIGFIRLMSYNSPYYDASFSGIGERRFSTEFQKYFDRINGWEIEYGLLESQRNKGIMGEAVSAVLEFCEHENLSPIYAKVHSMTNIATVRVLEHHNFNEYMPQSDKEFPGMANAETMIKNKECGMIYKWMV